MLHKSLRSKPKKQARYRLYVGCTPGDTATIGTPDFETPPFDPEYVRKVGIERSPFSCLTVSICQGVWKEERDNGSTILEKSVVFEAIFDDAPHIREESCMWAESVRDFLLQDAVLLTIERVEATLFRFDEASRPGLTDAERVGIRRRQNES